MRIHSLAIFLTCGLLVFAGWVVAQPSGGARPAKPAGPGDDKPRKLPPFDAEAPEQLLALQDDQLRLQSEVLRLQESVESSLESGEVPPDDPRLEEMRRINKKLAFLRAQAAKLVKRLPPPEKMPPDVRERLKSQNQELREGIGKIKEGLARIRTGMREEQESVQETPDPEPPEEPPSRPPPASAAEAGEAIHRGDVESPRSLMETFLQIPDQDVPKANLDYYRRQHR